MQLNTIKQYLSEACARGISVNVSNPNYEFIQVRCSVLFKETVSEKSPLHSPNRDLIDYISSWGNKGPAKQFDWEFYDDEIAAFIRELAYVEFVTNLSILKVTTLKRDSYQRTDSVFENRDRTMKIPLKPKYPWCVAIPVNYHAIEILQRKQTIDPEVTGYGELEIGNNFILS
jgi:hypothetical protein